MAGKKVQKVSKKVCGKCAFFVANKDKKSIGVCLQVSGTIKQDDLKCNGKFFKQGTMKFENEGFN